jgi:Asp-tRNA(Asn)/Glu-tRNA(Gln) amidotransferase A subunit family amidase
MKIKLKSTISLCLLLFAFFLVTDCRKASDDKIESESLGFTIKEATIADIHQAIKSGDITCRKLVERYLKRIDAYDQPLKLNSIVVINPIALKRAEELDKEFASTRILRPLHGIPVIVKDNYDTKDLQTAAGSLALKGSIPPDDAYQVRKMREAGAIVLAKSNMAEWAFSPYQTESSIAGTTRNPYDLERVPAGSSGGTAAAVAANLGTVGLGTDTGNSIRGPSSHNCLVGIRSTMGLTSRDGIVPLYLRNDIGGPMARTVEDAVRILEVIAGYDPNDPITRSCIDKIPDDYTRFLDKEGLKGARIGIFRYYTDKPTTDPQIKELFEKAIEDMRTLGAKIIDPFPIPNFEELTESLWCDTFRYDVNNYLASLGDKAPFKTLADIVNSGLYAAYIEERLKEALETPLQDEPPCKDLYAEPQNIAFRKAVLNAMDEHQLDAFVFPTWSNPPRKIGDLESPAGDNSQLIPPHTGFPGFTVPMGFTYENLPAGLQIVGRLFGEPDIIKIAYAYEQATQHRRPPARFPLLK